jgi:hypothetical protein
MAVTYTLSNCVIEGIINGGNWKEDFAGLLMEFVRNVNNSHCKLAIDKDRKAIDAYLSYGNPHISSWVEIMGLTPSSWELIDIGNSALEISDLFKEICSYTADKVMIVHSHNGWVCSLYEMKGEIMYNKVLLSVIDACEAKAQILAHPQTTNILVNNSVIATDGSRVSNVTIGE